MNRPYPLRDYWPSSGTGPPAPGAECYCLDDLLVDADAGRVERDGAAIELPRLSYDLLLALIRAAPATLSVDQLMDQVWPGLVVNPETVSQRVKLLRDALDDNAHHPRYIAGVRGRGYRLAAEVRPMLDRRRNAEQLPHMGRRWALLASLLIVALALWQFGPRPDNARIEAPVGTLADGIAVLPFAVRAASGQTPVFFADGIHDDLLTRLTGIPGLRVISRSSVMPYRDSDKNLRQIGDELGVGAILEGSVQQVGEHIRINAQLIDAHSDEHLWAETFDRQLTVANLLAIQGEIAEAIARSMQLALEGDFRRSGLNGGTVSLEAYQHLLIGRDWVRRFLSSAAADPGWLRLAEDHFRRAIAADPDFARGHASLGQVIVQRQWTIQDLDTARLAEARTAAERALELAPDLGDAHLALALYHYYGFRDYQQALQEIAIAEQRLPGSSDVQVAKGWILLRQGRADEALASMRRAADLDPRNNVTLLNLGRALGTLKRHDELEALLAHLLELDPDDPTALQVRAAIALLRDGDPAPLRAFYRERPEFGDRVERWQATFLDRDWAAALAELAAWPAEITGRHDRPRSLFEGLTRQYAGEPNLARAAYLLARDDLLARIDEEPDFPQSHANLGLALAGLGEYEAALASSRHATDLLPIERDAVIGYELLATRATVAAMAGDADTAIAALDRVLSSPGFDTIELYRLDPRWDGVRDHPGFVALVDKHTRRR